MKIEDVKISSIKLNDKNPRLIKDDKFKKLVKSIQDFPAMLNIRPIVVNNEMVVLGGNMRLRACKEAGLKVVPIIKADDLTPEQQNEFIIKDNVGFGEWDWDLIANEWNENDIKDWGLDTPTIEGDDNVYTSTIKSPIYEPKTAKPKIEELFNKSKFDSFLIKIEESNVSQEEKDFLKLTATRFIEFNYKNIAEYYSHSGIETKKIIEDLALVIIDYKKAIEDGFVKLFNNIKNIADTDG